MRQGRPEFTGVFQMKNKFDKQTLDMWQSDLDRRLRIRQQKIRKLLEIEHLLNRQKSYEEDREFLERCLVYRRKLSS